MAAYQCLRILAPSPGIVPGQVSFEIGHFSEKPESIDNSPNHFVRIRPLVLAKESGQIVNAVIACTHDPFTDPAAAIAAPQFEHRQRANNVAIKNPDRDFRKIMRSLIFERWVAALQGLTRC